MNQLAVITPAQLPTLITASGDRASWRFMEFFTAAIRTPNTRFGGRFAGLRPTSLSGRLPCGLRR